MDDFLKNILEIDKAARKVTVNSDELKAQADNEINNTIDKIKQESKSQVEQTVTEFEKSSKDSINLKLEQNKQKYDQILLRLDEQYKQNKGNWLDQLFERSVN